MRLINCLTDSPDANFSRPTSYDREICQRHILAFGPQLQERLSQLTIGVGAVGGIGMLLIEQLMRLFPAKLILIDRDIVDKSNLNRLPGATLLDTRLKLPKTSLAARQIWSFNPDQQLEIVNGDFLQEESQLQFRECDVMFSCFDRVAPRLAANQLCQAHGILLLDLGSGAIVQDGELVAAGGQVIRVVPGNGLCLACAEFYDRREAAEDLMTLEELSRQQQLGYVRGANIDAPQVYALNAMVAAWGIWTLMRTVAGDTLRFDRVSIDALDWITWPWVEERKPGNNCPVCGGNGLLLKGDQAELLVRAPEKPFVPDGRGRPELKFIRCGCQLDPVKDDVLSRASSPPTDSEQAEPDEEPS